MPLRLILFGVLKWIYFLYGLRKSLCDSLSAGGKITSYQSLKNVQIEQDPALGRFMFVWNRVFT